MLFPLRDTDLVNWLNKFAGAVGNYSSLLGLTPSEVLGIKNDAAMLHYLVCIELPAYEEALTSRNNYKQLVKYGRIGEQGESVRVIPAIEAPPEPVEPGIVPRLHQLVLRIKSSPNFTEALCEELGFVDCELESGLLPGDAKPTGRAIGQSDNEVRVEFTKSAFDGVLIESRRTGQDEWRRLATDNFSPYVDSRPLVMGGKPEIREYRMRFLKCDEPVGEWSDILVATASA